jgi:hypothetical protein
MKRRRTSRPFGQKTLGRGFGSFLDEVLPAKEIVRAIQRTMDFSDQGRTVLTHHGALRIKLRGRG